MEETKSDLQRVFRHAKLVGILLMILLAVLYLASGCYSVKPEQRGVVKRFGRVVNDNVLPGIHYHWPWPIESVLRARTTEIRSLSISFGSQKGSEGQTAEASGSYGEVVVNTEEDPEKDVPIWAQETDRFVPVVSSELEEGQAAELLTGDENLVLATLLIQYTIKQPKSYLYNAIDTGKVLNCIVQDATISKIAEMSVDDVLTTGRFEIQMKLKEQIQTRADSYDLGIRFTSVQIQNIQPPAEAAEAFREVASAREDQHRLMQQAEGDRNRRLPEARANANKLRNEAAAYAKEVVEMAHGEAERFLMGWDEYRKAKTVTAHRLYMEAMEEILPRVRKLVSDPEAEGPTPFPQNELPP